MAAYPQALRIDLRRQSELVRQRGERVLWQAATLCPCGPDPAHADPACQACRGRGFLYAAPVALRALITDARLDKQLEATGLLVPGDLTLSQDPLDARALGDWDLIRPTWPSGLPFPGEIVRRGLGPQDPLQWPPEVVQRCLRVDPATGAVEDYVPGVDFVVQDDALLWQGPHQPPAGARYSIRYTARLEYVVWTPPFVRFERGTSLGQRVLLRKRQLAWRQYTTGQWDLGHLDPWREPPGGLS